MPGACQLSGNVVPAVGKSEGATPRRILYWAITCPKIFILLSKFSPMFSIFVSALMLIALTPPDSLRLPPPLPEGGF